MKSERGARLLGDIYYEAKKTKKNLKNAEKYYSLAVKLGDHSHSLDARIYSVKKEMEKLNK